MWPDLRQSIRRQFNDLANRHPSIVDELSRAWKRTVLDEGNTLSGKRLIPFVGSGLNVFAGGVSSWSALIEALLEGASPSDINKRELIASSLGNSERLQILLAAAISTPEQRQRITHAFRTYFNPKLEPSALHRRLMERFPHVVTTNYNDLLERSLSAYPYVVDATDPTAPEDLGLRESHTVIHLHGVWPRATGDPSEQNRRIFNHVLPQDNVASMLVLTESQYHHLYDRDEFGVMLENLFHHDSLVLFLGSGLTRDEFGLHSLFRMKREVLGRSSLGLYVGFDVGEVHARYLGDRNLAVFSLPGKYGWSSKTREAVWHALFDELEERFGKRDSWTCNSEAAKGWVPVPDILLCGLASQQTVICASSPPATDQANYIGPMRMIDEPGGQFLVPALYLALHGAEGKGRRVALATRLGEDERGDWVLERSRSMIELSNGLGDVDTRLVLRTGGGWETRRTVVVNAGIPQDESIPHVVGTRTIYDYENHDDIRSVWLESFRLEMIRERLSQLDGIRALYLSPIGFDLQREAIDVHAGTEFRFLETGTLGGHTDDAYQIMMSLALKCTHVLASVIFVLRVAVDAGEPASAGLRKDSAENQRVPWLRDVNVPKLQRLLFDQLTEQRENVLPPSVLSACHRSVFGNGVGILVVTLGAHGAAYYRSDESWDVVPAGAAPEADQIAWIGCGDMFRAGFIDAVLEGKGLGEACEEGNRIACDRTTRIQTVPSVQNDP